MDLLILVVTMTGTAEMVAEDVVAAYGGEHQMRMALAERCSAEEVQNASNLLVISSTYGEGEVPDPGKPLFAALSQAPARLAHLRFGVISLGDSVYADTFANGGRHWDRLLADAGAQRQAEPLLLDASAGEDFSARAVQWVAGYLQAVVDREPR